MLYFCTVLTIVVGFLYYSVLAMLERIGEPGILTSKSSSPASVAYFLESQRMSISWVFVLIFIASIVMTSLGILFLSHRIVGPLYRIVTELRKAENGGEFVPFRLRKGDYFGEVASVLNSLLEKNKRDKK